MPLPQYEIIHYTSGGTPTTLSNVQEIRFSKGRRNVSDSLRAGTGTIGGRRPDLLPTIEIGDEISVTIKPTGGLGYNYRWRLSDLRIMYGTTSAYDTWEIDIEDTFAVVGRGSFGSSWADGTTASSAMNTVVTNFGGTTVTNLATKSLLSAQVIVNKNGLDVLNTIAVTEQARFETSYSLGSPHLAIYGRGWQSNLTTYDLSDDGTGTTPIRYNSIEFAGLADNYADRIVVNPVGGTTQSAGIGAYSYETDSYSRNNNDALNLAQYLLGVFNTQDDQPNEIEIKLSANTSTAADNILALCGSLSQLNIKFRGTTYKAVLEGFTIAANVDDITVTGYLSSPEYYPLLILDNTTFGLLDQGRLGY